MQEFVEYGPLVTFRPTFKATGGDFLGLVLTGDQKKLQELVDRVLNTPAEDLSADRANPDVRYTVMMPFVVLITGTYNRLESLTDPRGCTGETSLALLFPVMGNYADGSMRLCLFAPFVFINQQTSLLCGREEYGYAKCLGEFESQPATAAVGPAAVAIDVKTWGGDLTKGDFATFRDVVKVHRPAPVAPLTGAPLAGVTRPADAAELVLGWENAWEVAHKIAGKVDHPDKAGSPNLVERIVKELFELGAPQVFLKQFRDCKEPKDACYQAVVEAPQKFPNQQAALLSDAWELELPPLPSHPIAGELGVADGPVFAAFALNTGQELELGSVVAGPACG